jgi:hypothetical protein
MKDGKPLRLRAVRAVIVACSVAVCATAGPAWAQSEARIIGLVTDGSGGVLPGVTVTASSPALQVGQLSSVTDEAGEYRLTPLPIGTYEVTFTLQGFQAVKRESVRVTAGFAARIDVTMSLGSVTETITVSGAAPVVDVTSTSTSTQLTKEALELTPTSRNGITSLLAQAPGMRSNFDVGGTSANSPPVAITFGQPGEPWASIEGIPTTSLQLGQGGGNGNYWDYLTIEEARVGTVGNGAEMPARGAQLNAIVKSGGNDFHGGASFGLMNHNLQSNNISDDLRAFGITSGNRIETRSDASADIGGRIVRDRLWFYGAVRQRHEVQSILGAFKPDGSPAEDDRKARFYTGKLSYQLNRQNSFVGFMQYNAKRDITGASQFVPWESRSDLQTSPRVYKIEWRTLVGNSMTASVHHGYFGTPYGSVIRRNNAPGQVYTRDIATLYQTGPNAAAGEWTYNDKWDTSATVTVYRPDFFLGNHQFETGFSYREDTLGRAYPITEDTPPFNGQLLFNNGAPFQVSLYNYPTFPESRTQYAGLYGKDEWNPTRRLTVSLGLRWAYDNGYVPASCREAATPPSDIPFPAACYPEAQFNIWKSFAPRVHAAFDLTGDGKTVLKGGWGRFTHMRHLAPEVDLANPVRSGTATYRWRDLNNNRLWDNGETNLDPNGPDFVSQTIASTGFPNPNEQQPISDEFAASLERELVDNFAVRATGVYSNNIRNYREYNVLRPPEAYNIPITRPDPGPDGRVGTSDDPGTSITFYEYDRSLAGQRFELLTWVNDERADQTFKSIEVAAFKRMSNGWQFAASYTSTQKHVPIISGFTPSTGASTVVAAPANPNAEIFKDDFTRESTGKVSGAYMLPWGLLASGNYEYRSGLPFARQVLFTGGVTVPTIVLNVEPIGTYSLPDLHLLDARVEKRFTVWGSDTLMLRANVFNVLNGGTVTGVTMRAGATFLRPTAIMPPRIVELSASYSF